MKKLMALALMAAAMAPAALAAGPAKALPALAPMKAPVIMYLGRGCSSPVPISAAELRWIALPGKSAKYACVKA